MGMKIQKKKPIEFRAHQSYIMNDNVKIEKFLAAMVELLNHKVYNKLGCK